MTEQTELRLAGASAIACGLLTAVFWLAHPAAE